MNLLIVDAEATMRTKLRVFLEVLLPRSRVLEAWNGASALELCAAERPELVLVDVSLPDIDGLLLTSRLRSASPAPVVVVMSYHGGAKYLERARAAGAFSVIAKDRLASELPSVLARALGPAGRRKTE